MNKSSTGTPAALAVKTLFLHSFDWPLLVLVSWSSSAKNFVKYTRWRREGDSSCKCANWALTKRFFASKTLDGICSRRTFLLQKLMKTFSGGWTNPQKSCFTLSFSFPAKVIFTDRKNLTSGLRWFFVPCNFLGGGDSKLSPISKTGTRGSLSGENCKMSS